MAKGSIIGNAHEATRRNGRSLTGRPKRPVLLKKGNWYERAESQVSISRKVDNDTLWRRRINNDHDPE